MSLFVALVFAVVFGVVAYRYIREESRVPELLDRYRPPGPVPRDPLAGYDLERELRDLDAVRSRWQADFEEG